MPRFPYINFPFPMYKNYSRTPPGFYTYPNINSNNTNHVFNSAQNIEIDNTNDNDNSEQKNKSNINNGDYLFDLFGLKIYSDDILLVSLIYFLYTEEVKDESLFIVLILLLLS